MDIVSQVESWAGEFLEEGLFLVNVDMKHGSKKIVVYIDGDQAVNIDQCRKLSRHLSEKLDEIDFGEGAYHLEVSTPGTDKPLKLPRQYSKHVGRELKVKMKASTELLGKLEAVKESGIALLLKDKKKGYQNSGEPKEIGFDEIAEAEVQLSFK